MYMHIYIYIHTHVAVHTVTRARDVHILAYKYVRTYTHVRLTRAHVRMVCTRSYPCMQPEFRGAYVIIRSSYNRNLPVHPATKIEHYTDSV